MSFKKRILMVAAVVVIFLAGVGILTAAFVGGTYSMAYLIMAIRANEVLNAWRYGLFTVICFTWFGVLFAKVIREALKD